MKDLEAYGAVGTKRKAAALDGSEADVEVKKSKKSKVHALALPQPSGHPSGWSRLQPEPVLADTACVHGSQVKAAADAVKAMGATVRFSCMSFVHERVRRSAKYSCRAVAEPHRHQYLSCTGARQGQEEK